MSILKTIGIICLTGGLLVAAGAIGTGYYLHGPPETDGPSVTLFVEPGMAFSQVADFLANEEIIRHAGWFRAVARYKNMDHQIRVGRYRIEPGTSIEHILETLVTGRGGADRVTIPEGLTIPEIAHILKTKADIDSLAFVTLAYDPGSAWARDITAPSLEGYLYPDTYYFYRGMPAEAVVQEMVTLYQNTFTDAYKAQAEQLGFTIHEMMTLASIVEQEAQIDEEREIISGVFHNRLRIGIKLEADPTVQYGIGRPNMRLYKKHLSDPSPYNTYVHKGLPPGPICSPGKASIHATLYPKKVPYLFFVARGDGSHIFSRSNREHNNARRKVKRNRT
jgi:UPF0755 protein